MVASYCIFESVYNLVYLKLLSFAHCLSRGKDYERSACCACTFFELTIDNRACTTEGDIKDIDSNTAESFT